MVQIMLSQTSGFNIGQVTSKYLGIPLVLLYNRVSTWEELIESTRRKVNNMSIYIIIMRCWCCTYRETIYIKHAIRFRWYFTMKIILKALENTIISIRWKLKHLLKIQAIMGTTTHKIMDITIHRIHFLWYSRQSKISWYTWTTPTLFEKSSIYIVHDTHTLWQEFYWKYQRECGENVIKTNFIILS